MPRFQYEGRDKTGKVIRGIIDAVNESTVALELIRAGTTPISIAPYVEETKGVNKFLTYLHLEYPSLQDLIFLGRQLHFLIKAGVPLVRSVRVVLESAKNYRLKMALADVLANLEGGQALSVCLRAHPKVFPTLMTALVSVGENTGSLDTVFGQVSVHFEREAATKKQVANAVRYPITVLLIASIAVVVINVMVIPAFARFFTQFKAALPLPTRILIASSYFFLNYWYILLLGLIGGLVCLSFYVKTRQGRKVWDRVKLKIPFIGDILKRALLARFARSFALCMRTGVPLLEAIMLIARATDNTYVADQIMIMKTSIEHGESLTVAATKSGIFTPLVLQMLLIGEETGEIDKLLDEVADYYEQEVDFDVKRLGDMLEPVLIIVISGLILILALGVFLPMWDIWKVALGK